MNSIPIDQNETYPTFFHSCTCGIINFYTSRGQTCISLKPVCCHNRWRSHGSDLSGRSFSQTNCLLCVTYKKLWWCACRVRNSEDLLYGGRGRESNKYGRPGGLLWAWSILSQVITFPQEWQSLAMLRSGRRIRKMCWGLFQQGDDYESLLECVHCSYFRKK